jgi:DNA-binding beta-propeller fold protein YncE
MKNLRLLIPILWMAYLAVSCTEPSDPVNVPKGELETGVLIMNEGAFGSNDGEVYHYEPSTGVIKEKIFQAKNLRPFGGLIQDMVEAEGRIYLVSNTGKVEVVAATDFATLGAVSLGLDITRSLVLVNQKLFISDWGPYDGDFNNPDSYVAVVNELNGGPIAKKIPVSSRPEGMFVAGNFLFVACTAAQKFDVINIATESVSGSVNVEGSPHQFMDIEGRLFLYATDDANALFHEVNPGNFALIRTIKIPLSNPTSIITLAEGSQAYIITSTGWPDYNDAVAKVSINDAQVIDDSFFTGTGFYGLGFRIEGRQLYVAENNGFQGNGTVTILSPTGQELSTLAVGRGPSGFIFK